MIPAAFDYRRARSVEEAVGLLADNAEARLLAGGHSLLPMMKLRLAAPALLVDIGAIESLRGITRDGDDLVVGAMTTHADLAASAEVRDGHAALAQAAAAIGDVQVRNRGTLGGSLAHADPAADYAAAALALDGAVEITGPDGTRSIPVEELFAGLLTTTLEPAEIITAVRFPAGAGASAYEKFAQPASGFAIVGVAAVVGRDDGGDVTTARLAATGVADRPVRLSAAEEALQGQLLDEASITAAASVAADGIEDVRSDMYAAADYRRHLLGVMTARALRRVTS